MKSPSPDLHHSLAQIQDCKQICHAGQRRDSRWRQRASILSLWWIVVRTVLSYTTTCTAKHSAVCWSLLNSMHLPAGRISTSRMLSHPHRKKQLLRRQSKSPHRKRQPLRRQWKPVHEITPSSVHYHILMLHQQLFYDVRYLGDGSRGPEVLAPKFHCRSLISEGERDILLQRNCTIL